MPTDPTTRFSDRVDFYRRGRPGYPAELAAFLAAAVPLSPADTVADVGAGTGLLTEPFVRAGHPTIAVEPNGPMLAAAVEHLGRRAHFRGVLAPAEATTLAAGSVALITVAKAFHWLDAAAARAEFARVLRPGGLVAVVYNERAAAAADDFTAGYQRLIDRHGVDRAAAAGTGRTPTPAALAALFGPGGYRSATFPNPQPLDRPGLLDRLRSSSYMPLPPDPRHDLAVADAGRLFDRHQDGGVVVLRHDTVVYYGGVAPLPRAAAGG